MKSARLSALTSRITNPAILEHLGNIGYELSIVVARWFIPLFSDVCLFVAFYVVAAAPSCVQLLEFFIFDWPLCSLSNHHSAAAAVRRKHSLVRLHEFF